MNSNELDALFTGLTGTSAKEAPAVSKPTSTNKDPEPTISKERARQKQHENERQEERFCTIISSEVLKKIRIIATREGMQIKDVIGAALAKAVRGYERKHGAIEEGNKRNPIDIF